MSALLDDSVNRQRSRKLAGEGDEPKTAGKSYKSKAGSGASSTFGLLSCSGWLRCGSTAKIGATGEA